MITTISISGLLNQPSETNEYYVGRFEETVSPENVEFPHRHGFLFTMIVMVVISLFASKINLEHFVLDRSMFKVEPSTLALIVITLLLLTTLYVKFW